jgi:Cu-Zn family superoxide dismutase
VSASLKAPDGAGRGKVTVSEVTDGAILHAMLKGFPPGAHAIHLHEKGACEPDFKASGGHFNPTGTKHGYRDGEGHHMGDLPNFWASGSGEAEFDVFVEGLHVCNGEMPLMDSDGAAVVVHLGKDDYATDPAGGAGERIACGALQK